MSDWIAFLLLGLGSGAVFGALGLALVVTYRSSGVVNFATGAIALYAAYTYAFLRQGSLFLPIIGLPEKVDLGGPLGFWPALAVTLVIVAGFGILLYVLVFRWLRSAPAVASAVASIGVMVVIQAALAQRLGTEAISVKPILPTGVYALGSVHFAGDRVWLAVTVLGVAAALSCFFRFTRFGLATRAAAETEKGALVSGLSPQRIAFLNWALSAMVAGLVGVLIAPIIPLVPVSYTLFIVPALAAALVAGFSSMGVAVVAGLVIGMLQSELVFAQTKWSWLPPAGMAEFVPLAVILVFLVLHGRPLPSRGALTERTLGRAPHPRRIAVPAVVAAIVGVLALLAMHGSYRSALIVSLILGVISLSWVVVTGYAGQVSLAQLTLAGVGAFMLSRLAHDWGVPFPIAPLLAASAAMLIGVVIGLPALRIRGLPVAIVTLALAVALQALWFQNNELNGGVQGAPVPAPSFFGLDLGIGAGNVYPRAAFGVICLAVFIAVAAGIAVLRRSRLGAAMLAVRASERSAAGAGVNVASTKIVAFAISSFVAGLGGSLLAYQQTVATADTFTALAGLGLFATVYLAGITSVSGGALAGLMAAGGLVFVLMNDSLSLGKSYDVLVGIGLVLTVILNPEGIVGPFHQLVERIRARRADATSRGLITPARVALESTPIPQASALVDSSAPALLELRDVGVRYGGAVAVDAVSLTIREGLITGLIGPNGAGKTSLIDAITGYVPASGEIVLKGRHLESIKRPHQRIRAGLGRTFQNLELYEDLTVLENILIGETAARRGSRHRSPLDLDQSQPDHVCDLLGLTEFRNRPIRELSQGHRQLVSIARALAGRPQMLLLDEPAAGLDTHESAALGARLHDIRRDGTSVMLVDHDMSLVLDVCDWLYVVDLGRLVASGTPADIRVDARVASAYLGSTHTQQAV